MTHTCSTVTPTTLPEEFRRWNRLRLEGGGAAENTEDEEQEAEPSGGPDGGEDTESSDQAGHASSEADDAQEHHSRSAEASEAESGGEENDSQANSDSVPSGSPGGRAEAPAPADEPDGSQLEGVTQPSGPVVQEPAEEPVHRRFRRDVRLCQTPEVCCLLPSEATTAHLVKIHTGLNYEVDFITDKALREISKLDDLERCTADADELYSRVTGLYSYSVAWVEIDDDGRKSV
eukprot:2577171-Pleurochrysis_carterae.AAC.1